MEVNSVVLSVSIHWCPFSWTLSFSPKTEVSDVWVWFAPKSCYVGRLSTVRGIEIHDLGRSSRPLRSYSQKGMLVSWSEFWKEHITQAPNCVSLSNPASWGSSCFCTNLGPLSQTLTRAGHTPKLGPEKTLYKAIKTPKVFIVVTQQDKQNFSQRKKRPCFQHHWFLNKTPEFFRKKGLL